MTFAIILILIIVIFVFIVNKNKSKPAQNTVPSANHANTSSTGYWDGFKIRKPKEAKEIELISGRDMSRLDNASAYQIVTTLLRWSQNANVPIGELKVYFIKEVDKLMAQGGSYEMFISKLKEEKYKEARQFGISPDFTACNFMIEFIEEDRQKKTAHEFSRRMAEKLNMNETEIEEFAESIEKQADELNLAPDISKLDREENRLFALAEEGAKMLDNLTLGISNNASLSKSGFAEARILCSTIVMDLHSNFQNEIDMDVQADRYFLLLHDATLCDTENVSDTIGFINDRIAFYKEQTSLAKSQNVLQQLQPNSALAKIFYTIYLHPECDTPENGTSGEVSTNDIVMFRGQFEKVIRHLITNRDCICGSQTETAGSKLQSEIENTLMLLFPESKRSQINQDMVYVLTGVVLDQIKEGNLQSSTLSAMPSQLQVKFSELASKVRKYSANHDDIEMIIEEAQTNIANKFKA